ncbi:asparaginase [Paractinoplanes globisporus]|uniref:Asparaginase n=1 Tax=Paractinoplanes globisporus TaxID=113565 RepID=A0ABW6WRR4_9ACTN|nr:asparaginase [Actinoplanes globisporus]
MRFPGPVLVVGMGGTIAMAGSGGVVPQLSARQLVDAVPGLDGTPLTVRTLRNRPGASLTLADLGELLRLIEVEGRHGAVVTQGTDTIEETAYALELLHRGPQPIVVTGAMRNPSLAGADGPANLLAAVRVAAAPEAQGLGCVVVLADEIHAAARVRKTHTSSVAAFASPAGGALGYVAEGRVHIGQRPVGRWTMPPLPDDFVAPRVGLYTATLGDDGALLEGLAAGLDGLVVAAFGVGHVPDPWPPVLDAIAARIPVVLASRIGAGFVATSTYGFPGSERDLVGRGLIPAGALDAYKARLLLQLTLIHQVSRERIGDAFGAAGGLGGAWPWPAGPVG